MKRAALAAIVAWLAAAPALAQGPGFEGTGQAPIANGDRVRARNRALDEAFRQAVDQAAATLLDPAALAAKQSTLKLTIEPRAKSYVAGYRVLDEGEDGAALHVHVSAEVALDRLEHDLGTATKAQSGPRLGVCAVDRGGGALPPDGARDKLSATLTAAGAVVTPLAAACESLSGNGEPTPPDAAATARAMKGANLDGALLAQYTATPAGAVRGSVQLGAHARARLDLIDAGGRVTWTSQGEHDGYRATPAAAAESTARGALDGELAHASEEIARRFPRTPMVLVRVEGLERWADLGALERTLLAVPGVSTVEPREFAAGTATLALHGLTDPGPALAAIAKAPPTASGARLNVRPVDARTLAVQIVPPPPPPLPTLPTAPLDNGAPAANTPNR